MTLWLRVQITTVISDFSLYHVPSVLTVIFISFLQTASKLNQCHSEALFYVYECFSCLNVCIPHGCSIEVRRGHRNLWTAMWVFGTESSIQCSFNCWGSDERVIITKPSRWIWGKTKFWKPILLRQKKSIPFISFVLFKTLKFRRKSFTVVQARIILYLLGNKGNKLSLSKQVRIVSMEIMMCGLPFKLSFCVLNSCSLPPNFLRFDCIYHLCVWVFVLPDYMCTTYM